MTYYKLQSNNHQLSYTNSLNYTIMQYKRDDKEIFPLYRSVIKNSLGKVVSFAPPKSVPLTREFYKEGGVYAEEFVDGTMINMFWDDDDWQIATRNQVGGYNWFYEQKKPFRDLFLDCLGDQFDFDKLPTKGLRELPIIYSFVIQHKANRIVDKISDNKIYLVEAYEIDNLEDGSAMVYSAEIDERFWKDMGVMRPRLYHSGGDSSSQMVDEMEKKYASITTPYFIMGVVFKNRITGMRAKSINPNYERVRKLRGNQANHLYRFLELREKGLVQEYLNYYPEEKDLFRGYQYKVKDYIYHLHYYYVRCYILRENPLESYPKEYKTHMYHLHEEYKTTGEKRTYNRVKRYFNRLSPAEQMVVHYNDFY